MRDTIIRNYDGSTDPYWKNSCFIEALFKNKGLASFEEYHEVLIIELIKARVKYFESENRYKQEGKKNNINVKSLTEEIEAKMRTAELKNVLKMFYECDYSLVDVYRFQNVVNFPTGEANYYYLDLDTFNNIQKYTLSKKSVKAFFNLCNQISDFCFYIPVTINGKGEPAIYINSTKSIIINEEHRKWTGEHNINLIMHNFKKIFVVLYEEETSPHTIYKCLYLNNYTNQKPGDYLDTKQLCDLMNGDDFSN